MIIYNTLIAEKQGLDGYKFLKLNKSNLIGSN